MRTIAIVVLLAACGLVRAADFPKPVQGDVVFKDYKFTAGQTLPELKMHFRTLGKPVCGKDGKIANAVLILHGTGGAGGTFVDGAGGKIFGGELFGEGQPLDAGRYYIIIPDNLGHGKSSRPSDGLKAKFPKYGYEDMVRAQHRMLTEGLKVDHLRLVMGTSMGGMHTWLWGQRYPDFMDALMPLASLPTQISGRNRMWRRVVIDAIRTDPEWKDGNYARQPHSLGIVTEMLLLMGSNPVQRQKDAPTPEKADKALAKAVAEAYKTRDANDILYAVESSFDYDPGPGLARIQAPLLAINFADDLINPPELGILEREIKKVPRGKAIVMPRSEQTRGHGTHTLAAVWKHHLVALMKETER